MEQIKDIFKQVRQAKGSLAFCKEEIINDTLYALADRVEAASDRILEENAKDLADIPDNVKNGLEIVPVSRMGEVLEHALLRKPEPIEWDATKAAARVSPADGAEEGQAGLAH